MIAGQIVYPCLKGIAILARIHRRGGRAEPASAFVVMLFGRNVTVLLGADGAGACGAVRERFFRLKELAGKADLFFAGCEDDGPDGVFVFALIDVSERSSLEIG